MSKDVLKLALEALELHGKQYPHMVKGYCLDAITAIKQALAAPVQEFVCSTGLCHYKPAAQPAQPAQKRHVSYVCPQCHWSLEKQPAPVQSLPFGVGGGLVAIKTLLSRDPCVHANTAIQMIDAILAAQPTTEDSSEAQAELEATNRQVEILSDALAESRREVAALKAVQEPVQNIEHCIWARNGNTPCQHTTPPAAQRQWVGLTDEQFRYFASTPDYGTGGLIRAIEAELKELNT